jgi:glycyl-tRNA synthetase (class II)
MDYSTLVIPSIQRILTKLLGETRTEDSDRLPSYSTRTVDVIHAATNMEICSISNRTDYEDNKVLEVAIGTDRCVYLFNN